MAAVLHAGGSGALLVGVIIALLVALLVFVVFRLIDPAYAGVAAVVTFVVALLLLLMT
jgi:hypothetical protein